MKQSFPKNKKRLQNKDIQLLLKASQKIHGENFVLYAAKNNLQGCRIAVAISKKTIKLSSKRNLFRRRIKAAFLQARREVVIKNSCDVLIVVRVQYPMTYKNIEKELFGVLAKIR
ncbi:MAG: ribonuclease P protein component [Candidatus Omnitrophota bacterium]